MTPLPSSLPTKSEIMAPSVSMTAYLDQHLDVTKRGPHKRLEELTRLLGDEDGLALQYDNAATLTASETFNQRAGNCLSLALMTVALAEQLELKAQYQQLDVPYLWDQRGDYYLLSNHINVQLSLPMSYGEGGNIQNYTTLVDFAGNRSIQYLPRKHISDETVLAMFFNNLAAESLTEQQPERAYWYAQQALQYDPTYVPSYGALGVAFKRLEDNKRAEQSYQAGLKLEPNNYVLLSNLLLLYQQTGQANAAEQTQQQLARLDELNPYEILQKAEDAYARKKYQKALRLYRKGLASSPYVHQLHFGLAKTFYALEQPDKAAKFMEAARELSPTIEQRQRYAAKLVFLQNLNEPENKKPR